MKRLKLEVTAPASLRYWLAVDDQDVTLVNGVGEVDVSTGEDHMLICWLRGKPQDELVIKPTVNEQEAFKVKPTRIPKGETAAAGTKRFKL